MGDDRTYRVLELLNFYSDTLARLPLTSIEHVGETAVRLIRSCLRYDACFLTVEIEPGEPIIFASKGVDRNHPSLGALCRNLWAMVDEPRPVACDAVREELRELARDLGRDRPILAAPMRILEGDQDRKMGIVIAAGPAPDGNADIDLMALDTLGSLVTGAFVNCVATGLLNQQIRQRREAEEKLERILEERAHAEERHSVLSAQLYQSQKMEAVGRLAGGIAHDFNNLLMAIGGYAELILDRIDEDSTLRPSAAEIMSATNRASALTRQLLTFSRKQIIEPDVLDLNTIVFEMRGLLLRVIGEDIQLQTRLDPKLGPVLADAGQIEQIIMNLAVNSRDAMPGGGVLTIETENVDVPGGDEQSMLDDGPYVQLVVRDSGTGMSSDVKDRIFDPFFTTKEHGKGTGLGLSTVYGIVQQNGGAIEVESKPGAGTSFRIRIPRVKQLVADSKTPVLPPGPHRGSETILLVEDDAAIRNLAGRSLQRQGYRVLKAGAGQAAIGIAKNQSIDMLITDLVMPEMNGRQLATALTVRSPELPVLFISGYADEIIAERIEPGMSFLQKPFTMALLASTVREILDESKIKKSTITDPAL